MQVAMFLQQQGFDEVYNLSGGIAAWSHSVDASVAQY
jgi:rhodanese-related sulfurtransferase